MLATGDSIGEKRTRILRVSRESLARLGGSAMIRRANAGLDLAFDPTCVDPTCDPETCPPPPTDITCDTCSCPTHPDFTCPI